MAFFQPEEGFDTVPGNPVPQTQNIPKDPVFRRLQGKDVLRDIFDGQNLMYPLDLIDPSTNGGHFILFNINETKGIRLDTNTKTQSSIDQSEYTDAERIEAENFIQGLRGLGQYTGLSNFAPFAKNVVTGTRDRINDLFEPKDTPRSDQTISRQNTALTGRTRRLKDSIMLYMPENMSVAYGAEYTQEDLTVAGTAVKGTMDFFNYVTGQQGSGSDASIKQIAAIAARRGINFTAGTLDSIAGLIGVEANTENYIDAYTRTLLNPHMEFIFKSINSRTFEYSFTFSPKSKRESEEVHKIIKTFKYHAHPSITPGGAGALLNYPSEFDISYFSGLQENLYLNRVLTCALTNISVNYSPQGVLSFFQESDPETGRAPTQIQITLTFQELGVLNRDLIEQGF